MVDAVRSYAPGFIFTTFINFCRPSAVGAATSVRILKTAQYLRDAQQLNAKILKLQPRAWACRDHRPRLTYCARSCRRPHPLQDAVRHVVGGSRHLCAADQLPNCAARHGKTAVYPLSGARFRQRSTRLVHAMDGLLRRHLLRYNLRKPRREAFAYAIRLVLC